MLLGLFIWCHPRGRLRSGTALDYILAVTVGTFAFEGLLYACPGLERSARLERILLCYKW